MDEPSMFIACNILYPTPKYLESPIHGTSETVPFTHRERVFKQHLRWALHSRWCVNATHRHKICNDLRCQQLRPVVYHIKTCKKTSFCDMPYCTITKECLAHFDSCEDDDCCKCKLMKYAHVGRFLPDLEMYPQVNLDLSIEERGNRIRRIVEAFYPEADYTNLQDERMEKEVCRARVIESFSHRDAEGIPDYNRLIEKEISAIKGSED
ncbi:hypothetical protein Aperf_G00000096286 [Anoplocephala perfoliata]